MNFLTLYEYPVWATGVIFISILLMALEVGYRLGRWWQKRVRDG